MNFAFKTRVILPYENIKDLAELPPAIQNRFEICPMRGVAEAFALALTKMPPARKRSEVPKVKKSENQSSLITH